jgi:hypothetical protein
MGDDLRTLLTDVAEGRINPAEAARRLAAGDDHDEAREEPAPARLAPRLSGVERVLVRVAARNVRLLGDAGVSTVAVEGPHRLSRDADAVVVSDEESRLGPESFVMSRAGGWRSLFRPDRWLTVRVNPALVAEVELSAGSLTAEGVPRLARVRVTAGSARVQDAADPLDLLVQAGSAVVLARPTGGRWTLRTESGSLSVRLLAGSDATVAGHASLAKVVVGSGGSSTAVVGSGAAQLDVEAVMGSAVVELPR